MTAKKTTEGTTMQGVEFEEQVGDVLMRCVRTEFR